VRRTKQEALETRSAILDAAEAVFHERGVGQTSLAQIATAADVTRGAIYWHFANKVELFKAMQARARLPQEEFFNDRVLEGEGPCLDLLFDTTLQALAAFAADERAQRVYGIILFRCEYVGEMREALVKRRDADDQMKRAIIAVFERAAATGQLAPGWTACTAANAYLCAVVGLLTEWLRFEERFDLLPTATPMLQGLFASFRG
jgi:AcrR family transcriptional regulator